MKKAIALLILTLLSFSCPLEFLSEDIKSPVSSPIESILPGMGFSNDAQTLAKTVCFHTETLTKSGQSSTVHFDESLDFQKLLNTFEIEASLSGGYELFGASAMMNYLRSLEENSYSLSVNYYQRVSHNIMMTYSYNPSTILTDVGKSIYSDGKNQMFRILCGDTLISSYEEGALLVLSMKVTFKSTDNKTTFKSKIGINFGSFISASTSISKTAEDLKINGTITIDAFQMGGDPSQLSKILSSKVIGCEIRNIEACQETAKALINYASVDFPNQFKKDPNGVWTSPLIPISRLKKDIQVSDFGLALPKSSVTKEVEQARKSLLLMQKMFKYYSFNLEKMIALYPFHVNEMFEKLLKLVNENISILYLGNSHGTKALDCFETPYKCEKAYQELIEYVHMGIENDILALMDRMKSISVFKIQFKDSMCLPNKYHFYWDGTINVEMDLYPTGPETFDGLAPHIPEFYTLKSFKVADFGNFQLFASGVINDYVLNYEFNIKSSQALPSSYSGKIHCFTPDGIVEQEYPINGEVVTNPLYFPKFPIELK